MLCFIIIAAVNMAAFFGYNYIVENLQVNEHGYLVISIGTLCLVGWLVALKNSYISISISIYSFLYMIFCLPTFSFLPTDIFMLIYFLIRSLWHEILSEYSTALYIAIVAFIYFVPSFVAYNRQHQNKLAIFFTNTLLGWTVIGWVGAIIWSGTSIKKADN